MILFLIDSEFHQTEECYYKLNLVVPRSTISNLEEKKSDPDQGVLSLAKHRWTQTEKYHHYLNLIVPRSAISNPEEQKVT